MHNRKTYSLLLVLALISGGLLGLLAIPSENLVEPAEADSTRAFAGGDGTIGDPYQISDVDQLQDMSSDNTAHYVLINDIDASNTSSWNAGAGFEPIGDNTFKFRGSLDGQGYNITDLFINRITTSGVGLIGYLDTSASLNNLSLIDNNVNGNLYVGGLMGYNSGGTVENCHVTGSVSGDISVGGFAGVISGTIKNCYSTGNVSGSSFVSGFAGYINSGTITNCYSTGNASGSSSVGGFAGYIDSGTITNCYSTGNASGNNGVSGFAGSSSGTIENCYSTGNANGNNYVGGFTGTNSGTIKNCYSTGNASGDDYIGGFAGASSSTIKNCYSIGNASGNNYVGGFAGASSVTIENCYSTGNASGNNYIGGFAGGYIGTIENCFWDTEASGMADSDGGTGKTTSEMKQEVTFTGAGWNLVDTWSIWDGKTYPYLNNLIYPAPIVTGIDITMISEDQGYLVEYHAESSLPGCTDFTWEIDTTASWLTMSADGILSGTPLNDDVGNHSIELICKDPRLVSTTRSFTLSVQNTNDVPEIDHTLQTTATEDSLYSMLLSAIDKDPTEDTLTWTLESGPTWLGLNTITNTLEGTPSNSDVGISEVNISVSDGIGGNNWCMFSITVANTNDAPTITTQPSEIAFEDQQYTIDFNAVDEDPVVTIFSWSMNTNADWLSLGSNVVLSGLPTNEHVGTYWVNITVNDNQGGSDNLNFTLTVNNTNDAPNIETTSLSNATEDVEYEFVLSATDVDAGDVLTWTLVSGPDWIELNGSTLQGTPTNEDVGAFWVQIEVDDGNNGSDVHEFTIVVSNTNDAPAWSLAPEDWNMTEGEVLFLDCLATDVDGDDITYSITTTPASDIIINTMSGAISWASPVVGTYIATIIATDGTIQIQHIFSIIVNEMADEPGPDDNQTDTDGDGMPDEWEELYGLDPDDPADAALDSDGDGISNLDEYKQESDPNVDESVDILTDKEDKAPYAGFCLIAGIILLLITIIIVVLVVRSRKGKKDQWEE